MSGEQQRTEAWLAARCGKFTASHFASLLAANKKTGEPLKAYRDLIWRIAVERITGQPAESIDGCALQWGREVEEFARQEYELAEGAEVEQTGFIQHRALPFAGCSPDGLVGENGGVEIKCPKSSAAHLERFLSGVPEEYQPQIQGCMWVTGRKWWDFASYDPRMPESHRLLIIRVPRDDAFIGKLEARVLEAERSVRELLEKLNAQTATQTQEAT